MLKSPTTRLVILALALTSARGLLSEDFKKPLIYFTSNITQHSFTRRANKTLDIAAGANVTLCCQGTEPMSWSYPDIDAKRLGQQFRFSDSRAIETSHYDNETSLHYLCLNLLSVVANDTGPATCFYTAQQRRSNTTFLFVNSRNQLHVGHRAIKLTAVTTQSATVPCVATSSRIKAELRKDGSRLGQDLVYYEKQKGFKVPESSAALSGNLQCHFIDERENTTQYLNVYAELRDPKGDNLKQPDIEIPSMRETYMVSETILLTCHASTTPDDFIRFTWNVPRRPPTGRDAVHHESNCTPTAYLTHCTSKLTLQGVKLSDSGRYTCIATCDETEYSTSSSVQLKVIENETVTLEGHATKQVEVESGSAEVTLNISAVTVPMPTIKWINNGSILPNNETGGKYFSRVIHKEDTSYLLQLVIKNVTQQEAGIYTMQLGLLHNKSVAHASVQLIVIAPPKLIVQPLTTEIHMWLSNSVKQHLRCSAQGNPPPVTWWQYQDCQLDGCLPYRDSSWVNVSKPIAEMAKVDSSQLINGLESVTTSSIELPKQSSLYRCVGENKLKRTASQAIRAIVSEIKTDMSLGFAQEASKFHAVLEGDTLLLSCFASKWLYEPPNVLWKASNKSDYVSLDYNKTVFNENKFETNYSYVTEIRMGASMNMSNSSFVCRARNRHTLLLVQPAEVMTISIVRPSPVQLTSDLNSTHLSTFEGSSITIACIVTDGQPRPNITWLKDGKLLDLTNPSIRAVVTDTDLNITIPRVHETDTGTYTCLASNVYGAATLNTTLYVLQISSLVERAGTPVASAYLIVIVVVILCVACLVTAITLYHRLQRTTKPVMCELLLPSKVAINPDIPIDEQTDCLPYDINWEFPKDRLRLGAVLGQGAFGRVLKAEATGIEHGTTTSTVAVKTIRDPDNMDQIKALISELKILIHVGQHLNIVNLLGAVTRYLKRGELYIIVEYCRFGNLRSYLLEHRCDYIDTLETASGCQLMTIVSKEPPHRAMPRDSGISTLRESVTSEDYLCPQSSADVTTDRRHALTTFDLLCWCFQIARGMQYLASIQYIHRDLAARNVLLCDENIVKICDFGLAKDIYKYNEYKKTTDGPLPIKWMALESLTHKLFTTASDVWSFGVTLWELFSLAATPYPGIELNEMFVERLQAGYRMEHPKHAPDDIYNIMLRCWHPDPAVRPTFAELSTELGYMLHESVRNHYLSLEEPYIRLREKRDEAASDCQVNGSDRLQLSLAHASTTSEDYLEPLGASMTASPSSEVAPSEMVNIETTMATLADAAVIRVDDDGYYNAFLRKGTSVIARLKERRSNMAPTNSVELAPLFERIGHCESNDTDLLQSNLASTNIETTLTGDTSANLREIAQDVDKASCSVVAVETVC